jgi:hypothetical protein
VHPLKQDFNPVTKTAIAIGTISTNSTKLHSIITKRLEKA